MPIYNFEVVAGDTVTANSGTTYSYENGFINVIGTLTLNSGSSITANRLNNGVTSTTGVVNVNGGNLRLSRIFNGTGGLTTVNQTAGLVELLDLSAGREQFNLSGGTTTQGSTGSISTIYHLTAGANLIYENGFKLFGSSSNGTTWNGGSVTVNNSINIGNVTATTDFFSLLSSNSANVLNISSKTSKQTFSTSLANVLSIDQATIQFDIYSAALNDSDQLGSAGSFNISSDVQFAINGVNLSGTAEDYIGATYQLLDFGNENYSAVAATLDGGTWTIGGADYTVDFTNNLATDGTIAISSLTPVPEPATIGLLTGMTALAVAGLRRRYRS